VQRTAPVVAAISHEQSAFRLPDPLPVARAAEIFAGNEKPGTLTELTELTEFFAGNFVNSVNSVSSSVLPEFV
jgi:hypothetical protein